MALAGHAQNDDRFARRDLNGTFDKIAMNGGVSAGDEHAGNPGTPSISESSQRLMLRGLQRPVQNPCPPKLQPPSCSKSRRRSGC